VASSLLNASLLFSDMKVPPAKYILPQMIVHSILKSTLLCCKPVIFNSTSIYSELVSLTTAPFK
jgi:hypothetical protein